MQFDLTQIPEELVTTTPKVGDVLQAKGAQRDTVAWLVAAIRGNSVYCLGLDRNGDIVSTAGYQLHALADRAVIGRCPDLAALRLPVHAA